MAPSKKKNKGKKKSSGSNNSNGNSNRTGTTATTAISANSAVCIHGIEVSKELFELRVLEYKSRNHGIIISSKPSIVAMKVASEATKKTKAAATATPDYTEFLRHCGTRVEDVLEYDTLTNTVEVRVLVVVLDNDDDDDDNDESKATLKSKSLLLKVPSPALIEELPSFSDHNETTKETIDRLISYEFISESVDIKYGQKTNYIKGWRIGGPSCKIYKATTRITTDNDDVTSMSLRAMKDELKVYDISTTTFIEKSEYIKALQHARESNVFIEILEDDGTTARTIVYDPNSKTKFQTTGRNAKSNTFPDIEIPSSPIPIDIVPDYDRVNAKTKWDIIHRLEVPIIDAARRVNDCIASVPVGRVRDVYKEFLACGINIHSANHKGTMNMSVKDYLNDYCVISVGQHVALKLLSSGMYIGESIDLLVAHNGSNFQFYGALDNEEFDEKYHYELKFFLVYQLFDVFVSTKNDDTGYNNKDLVMNLYTLLVEKFKMKKRFSELIAITIQVIRRAVVVDRRSVEVIAKMCNELGEYYEAKGHFKLAALVYAEAGEQLNEVYHHLAPTLLLNAGLAWKRSAANKNGTTNDDDLYEAERYYAMALHSVKFIHGGPRQYRNTVFCILTNLFRLYQDHTPDAFPGKCAVVVQELFREAGEALSGKDNIINMRGTPSELRPDLWYVGKDRIACVIQSIIEASVSSEDMRSAIIDCGDPETINSVMKTYGFNDHRTGYKDDARKAIKEKCYHQGIIQSCSSCHKRNEDSTLLECECQEAAYCNKKCRKKHWPSHKPYCIAKRKGAAFIE